MTLIIELFGLSLAILEIYFPKKSLMLEEYIDSLPKRAPIIFYGSLASNANKSIFSMQSYLMDKVLQIGEPKTNINPKNPKEALLAHSLNFIQLTLFAGFMGAILYGVAWLFDIEPSSIPRTFPALIVITYIFSVFGIAVNILAILFVGIIKAIVWSLNKLTFGRALGAIGLLITLSGLMLRFV